MIRRLSRFVKADLVYSRPEDPRAAAPDRPGDHLRALENISRQLRDDTFCRFLKQSKSAADVWQLLEEADNNQFGG